MFRPRFAALAAFLFLVAALTGCGTSFRQYVRNGFKVGPNYSTPSAAVAEQWIDAPHIPTANEPEQICRWWTVFNDRKLNHLVSCAYRQNLSLRQACYRVLQARAQLAVARGDIFPQSQYASGDYRRSGGAGSAWTNTWDYGFGLQWELDFWGRLRRAVTAATDNLEASVADYDGVLVTMLGDIAKNYVQVRTDQERIRLLRANADIQRDVLNYIDVRLRAGFKQTELDSAQSLSTLRQTEAGIPTLEIDMRQAEDALCVLLGIPTVDLRKLLDGGPIPSSPPEVALGIPCDLLRRRPDVRQAERLAAAQGEQIGIAEAELYPIFTINGTMGYTASNFGDLFKSASFNANAGPSFQWNLLNYGRIVNNVRYRNARFQELVAAYQQTVLQANSEVENGLATFLESQRRTRLLDESVVASERARGISILRYKQGVDNFTTYAVIEQNLVTQQDSAAQARGQIAQGLIATYRALGGGWELRLSEDPGPSQPAGVWPLPAVPDQVPVPNQGPVNAAPDSPPPEPPAAPVPNTKPAETVQPPAERP
ncbi:MAG: efflux transporter outer membrane subunit [Thermoguttaceae bacterium]